MEAVEKKVYPDISREECKGCERCVNACPKKVIRIENMLNATGYRYAVFAGEGCVGCGACFYACPEPGAITIVEETGETGHVSKQKN